MQLNHEPARSRHVVVPDRPNQAPMEFDVRIWRERTGVYANVPRSVIWHSPGGFECGYAGSGPADLALNILNAFVPPDLSRPIRKAGWSTATSPNEPMPCPLGACSAFAAEHHQDFKWQFIAGMPRRGGIIEARVIRTWIRERIRTVACA